MTSGDAIQEELEAIEQAVAERSTLRARSTTARELVATRHEEEFVAADGLDRARAAVASLDGLTLTRLRTSFTGRRTEELMRARTALSVEESKVAVAQDRTITARHDVERLEGRIAVLGDLEARRERALEARAAWLASTDPQMARALEDLAARTGATREILREVGEAQSAATEAQRWLDAADAKLSSADGWSTYDTFFGGGMISSVIKHDRMDDASSLLRRADLAMARLGEELGDVGLPPVGGVEVSELTRTMDIWMDNIFSDLRSEQAIWQAHERTREARRAVAEVSATLDAHERTVRQELAQLSAERTALLAG